MRAVHTETGLWPSCIDPRTTDVLAWLRLHISDIKKH